jgi:methyl-accepting chemotaxis protein
VHTQESAFAKAPSVSVSEDLLAEKRAETNQLFKWLFLAQYLVGIVIALVVSPRAWEGAQSSVHIHLISAVALGAVTALVPALLAWRAPRAVSTMLLVTTGQMLTGALWIHLAGGRVEMHFHVFVSIGLLAMYRDWRALLLGAGVAAVDHVVRGLFFPMSIFGVGSAPWRFVEHAAWVVVETAFLGRFAVKVGREVHDAERASRDLRAGAEAMIHELQCVRDRGELTRRMPDTADATLRGLTTSVNDLLGTLETVISRVSGTAVRVAESSNQIASATEETTVSMSQMAQDAEATRASAEESGRGATTGAADIRQTIVRIKEIGRSVQQTAQTVGALNERSGVIDTAIREIAAIATKTNLLSLNATIEAARAGEHGRGFAVVAEEVRKLAEASRRSADQIGKVVAAMTADLSHTHGLMRACSELATRGADEADTAAAGIDGIVQSSAELTDQVRRISGAASEVHQTTQLSAEQCARLAQDADELRGLVSRFRVAATPHPTATAGPVRESDGARRPASVGGVSSRRAVAKAGAAA